MKVTTHNEFDELLTAVIKKKDYTLSEKQLEMHQMLMYAATLLREFGLASNCIDQFAGMFQVSENTARNYLNAAPRYYSIVEPIQEANFIKSAIYAKLLETRKEAEGLEDDVKRVKALNDSDKNLLSFAKDLLPSANAIDYSKFIPQPTIIEFNPSLIVEQEMTEEELEIEIMKLKEVKEVKRKGSRKYDDYEEV